MSLSEISFLAIIVGGACGVILLILTIIMAVKLYKKKRREDDFELHEHDFKDPTVWWGPENSVFWDWCGLWLAVGLILLEEMTNKDKGIFFYVFSSIVNVLNINVFFFYSVISVLELKHPFQSVHFCMCVYTIETFLQSWSWLWILNTL